MWDTNSCQFLLQPFFPQKSINFHPFQNKQKDFQINFKCESHKCLQYQGLSTSFKTCEKCLLIIISFKRKWRNTEFNKKGYSPRQWLISHFSSFIAKNFVFTFSSKVIDNFVIDDFNKFTAIFFFTHSWRSVWKFLRMITHSLEGEYKLTWECVKAFEGPHTHSLESV